AFDRPGELEREPCLACATGSRERQQSRAGKERPKVEEFTLAADEGGRLDREPAQAFDGGEFRKLGRQGQVELGKLRASVRGPVVVPVLGQEFAPVERERVA